MGKTLIISLIIFLCFPCFAQSLESDSIKSVSTILEDPAIPSGGYDGLYAYFEENIRFPESKKKRVNGKVLVQFTIDEDGLVISETIQIVSGDRLSQNFSAKGVLTDSLFEQEAIRLVQQMPPWKPAYKMGKLVKQTTIVPVRFKYNRKTKR
ncbi:MAG: energy transducer TonB [Bacteroidota bacterium]